MWCLCAQPTAHSSLLLLLLRILGQSKNSSGFWDNAPSSEEEEDGMEERRARLFIIFFLSFFVSTFQCVSYSQGSCIGKNICNHFCPKIAWLQSMSWFVQKAGWPLKMIGAEAHNYPRSKTRWLKGSLYFRLSLSFFVRWPALHNSCSRPLKSWCQRQQDRTLPCFPTEKSFHPQVRRSNHLKHGPWVGWTSSCFRYFQDHCSHTALEADCPCSSGTKQEALFTQPKRLNPWSSGMLEI